MSEKTTNGPVEKLSAGPESAISGAVWENENKNGGRPFYTGSISRTFKQGDEFKRSTISFSRQHIEGIRVVLDQIEQKLALEEYREAA